MKKLFAFFWDKSLLIFAIIGAVNTVITMVGTQLLMGPFTSLWGETQPIGPAAPPCFSSPVLRLFS